MASLVHPLPGRDTRRDDAGPLEAPVPPVVQAVDAHRLVHEERLVHPGAAVSVIAVKHHLASAHQVVVRLGLALNDETPEVVPDPSVGDRQVADLTALREDREPLSMVIEVLELDAL